MKVLLVDIDSKIPNLALMKIAAYHRLMGDEVGFNIPDPDKVYASVIFKTNEHKVDGLRFFHPNAEIDIGGSGYSITKKLPSEIDSQSPDYSIYPNCESYYGFTTRGCIRSCYFCIVPRKEGKFRRIFDTGKEAVDHIIGSFEGRFDRITFLDNNILADKDYFFEVTDELITRNLKCDFNQGLDVRLLDSEIAGRLAILRPFKPWKFAFDDMKVKDHVLRGIDLLRDAGIDLRHKVEFYVYCHGQEQVSDAVERCRLLKKKRNICLFYVQHGSPVDPRYEKTKTLD